MKQQQPSVLGHDEDNAQSTLDSLTHLASQMGHASYTMEIIGIARPEDANTLQQKTSQRGQLLTLPTQPAINRASDEQ